MKVVVLMSMLLLSLYNLLEVKDWVKPKQYHVPENFLSFLLRAPLKQFIDGISHKEIFQKLTGKQFIDRIFPRESFKIVLWDENGEIRLSRTP